MWLGLLVVRALWAGVYARPRGIVIRGFGLTRIIPSGTAVTETVYRHQFRPALLSGEVAMDRIFDGPAG